MSSTSAPAGTAFPADAAAAGQSTPAPSAGTPVVALFSPRASIRKYHLDVHCPTLEQMRERGHDPHEMLEVASWDSLDDLAADAAGRPCRLCSLEQVLTHVLPARPGEPVTFVTATGQPSSGEAFTAAGRTRADYRFDVSTDTAADRLRRICAATGLGLTHASIGPVAFGFVPSSVVPALTRNLRTIVRPDVTTLPSAETIAVVWSLLAADPPELRAALVARGVADAGGIDPWQVADLIFAAAGSGPVG